jgi:hypothetical protein
MLSAKQEERLSANWVKARLAKDDPAVVSKDTREDDDVFINIATAGLIYRRPDNLGSYVWFSADPRDHETSKRVGWEGFVAVKETPEELLGMK